MLGSTLALVSGPRQRFSAKRHFGLLSGYVALSAVDTWLAGTREHSRIRWATKPLLMPTLAAAMTQRPNNELAPAAYVSLAASWVGDIALLNRSTNSFLQGLAAFSVAQTSYLASTAHLRDRQLPLGANPIAKGALGTALVLAPGAAIAASLRDPKLGPAVAGYGVLLGTHAAAASHLDPNRLPARNRRARLLGALSFLLSDTVLGVRSFLVKDDPPALESAVMATYTAAQFLLVESTRASHPDTSPKG